MFRRSLAIAAALGVALSSTPREARAQVREAEPRFGTEVSVTLVQIPVEVERDGQPVEGLTAADFEVFESKKALPILSVEPITLVTASQAAPEAAPVPAGARRYILLYFDFALTQSHRLLEGVKGARAFVTSSLAPSDRVAIVASFPSGRVPVLLPFTDDHAAADEALGLMVEMMEGKRVDPRIAAATGGASPHLQQKRTQTSSLANDILAGMPRSTGAREFASVNRMYEEFLLVAGIVEAPLLEAVRASHISAFHHTMGEVAEALRRVDGRKILTLFSASFANQFSLKDLDTTVARLRRSGWVVNAIDLEEVSTKLGDKLLFILANETGGQLVEGTRQIAPALGRMFERSMHSYLLTVEVDVPADGAYHPLRVALRKEARDGARIRHREGYFAPTPRKTATQVAAAGERDDLSIDVVAIPLRGDGELVPVVLVIEVPGEALLADGAKRTTLEVMADGAVSAEAAQTEGRSDHFAKRVELDRAKVGDRLAKGGVRVLGRIDLPRGQQQVRVAVRDRETDRASLRVVTVDGNAVTSSPELHLAALFLAAPGDEWLEVGQDTAGLKLHGREIVPAARLTLERNGEAPLLILGSGLVAAKGAIAWTILGENGQAVDGGAVDLLALTAATEGEPDMVVGRLRAGSLPPGDYQLVFTGGGGAAPSSASSRAFTIASAPTG